jgi:tryptophan synthase alpha chain
LVNRIDETLASIRIEKKIALVPYLTVGYPTISLSGDLALSVLSSGADMVELGIPFSDPLADGPTIQMTSQRALENGVTLQTAFDTVRQIRFSDTKSPLIFMGYFNPFLRYGLSKLIKDSSSIGIDGLIIPDLPTEESYFLVKEAQKSQVHLIPLLAPTSTDERIESACEIAGGFIYCVSLTGVTGARSGLDSGVESLVGRIRKYTDLPIMVGFGVSRKEDVENIGYFADGAVVGSALLDAISNSNKGEELNAAANFVSGLRN